MIQIENLDFSYRKNSKLFDNISITLNPGNVYGLLGKNGAGKTTLLKILCGLLTPKAGICSINSIDTSLRLPLVLEDIYLVPEEFTLPALSMQDYAKVNGVFYKKFDQKLLTKLITEFELPTDVKMSGFSYGMKKKFLIAFGIATHAKVLILDEPTNGLDIPSKMQFRRIIASSLSEERIFIISTHQVRDLESILDTIVILEQGKIIFNFPIEKISAGLAFKSLQNEETDTEILYSEETLGGKHAIVKKVDESETKIELELLFNGVLSNQEKINNHLNNL